MKRTTLTTVIILLLSSTTFGQSKKDLNIDFMLRGNIYVKSSIIDSTALGGFGGSKNLPKKINDSLAITNSGLFLKIDTAQTTTTLNTPQPLKIKLSKHLTYFPKDNLLQSTRSPLNPNSAVIINPKITDKKIALKVIKANKEAFCYLSKELKEDPDIKKELGLE